MISEPHVKITITVEASGPTLQAPTSWLLKRIAEISADPPGFGPIYRGPIRTAPGLHPYQPTLPQPK